MKVTIITAVYNSASTLQNTIDSINSQSYSNIEHIIIDGNSTDGSAEIAIRNIGRRCKVISEADRGYYDALNKGISLVEEGVIGILNADDVYADGDVIKKIVANFAVDRDLDCVYGDLNYVAQKNGERVVVSKWISSDFSQQKIKYGWMPPHPTIFLRKSAYKNIGIFDLSFKISSDYDFILRAFASENFKCKYLPQLMVLMQLGGLSNRSWINIFIKMIEDYKVMKKNQLPPFIALFIKNACKLNQLKRFF